MSLASSGVAGFIGVRIGLRRVHMWPLGSLGCALGVVEIIRVAEFIDVHPGCHPVHAGSVVSLWCALGVVRFIRGRWVPWRAP